MEHRARLTAAADPVQLSRLRITTAAEAAARDQAAIQNGAASFALMLQAGSQAAAALLRDFSDRLQHGVALYAGVGNNGGDAYIVAAQLARAGVKARVHAVAVPRTEDAQRAAALCAPSLVHGPPTGGELLVVDGLLGTGHRGSLRDEARRLCDVMTLARERKATIAALDLPSGLDATTGAVAQGSVAAHVTLTFGTIKRGLLFAREHTGRILLLDIGLARHAQHDDCAWMMADAATIARLLPSTPWDAHKGRRGRLALVGGATGMAGALILSTRAALAAGCGLVRCWTESSGVPVLQQAVPQAITDVWPAANDDAAESAWGTALAIGPGLGRGDTSYALLKRALRENVGVPILLDADALTLMASHTSSRDAAMALREIGDNATSVVCTPHPREFERLLGAKLSTDWQARADVLQDFSTRANVIVVLKGTPTLVASPSGNALHTIARGTALLATGGSGDILTGLIGALLSQGIPADSAALLGATVHGLAAEIATDNAQGIRGLTLDDVLHALPAAWRAMAQPTTFPPGVIAELPAPRTHA